MTSASIAQKIISFAYFTIIARFIGVENTGSYFFALSFTTIFVVFVDLGFTNVLVREGAKYRDKISDYLSTILSVKILLGLVTYILMVFILNLLGYSGQIKSLIYLSGVTMLFDSLHLTMYGVFRARGDFRFEAGSIMISQFVTLILGSIFLYLQLPLIFLILAFTIPSVLNALFAGFVLMKKFSISLVPRFDRVIFKHIAKITIPFAIASILARFYSYADSMILSKIATLTDIGFYAIPYKITFAFQFIPLALVASLYPKFSEQFLSDRTRLSQSFLNSVRYLLIIVLPISVGVGVLSRDIILLLYTEMYLPSVLPLQILLGGLLFSFVSFPIGAFLNACDRQKTQTKIVAFVLIVNILLNLLLIPKLGIVGAAISASIGNFLLTVLGLREVRKIIQIEKSGFLIDVSYYLLCVSIMGVIVYLSSVFSSLLVSILVGFTVYPLLLFATKRISSVQLRHLYSLVKSKNITEI